MVKLSAYGRNTDGGVTSFDHRDGDQKLPVILSGSHIDSVMDGGDYYGDVALSTPSK